MLLVLRKGNDYYYIYLNDDSYDPVYGLTPIKTIAVGSLIVPPEDVFKKVESIKELDNVTIALTDHGFWDIEPN